MCRESVQIIYTRQSPTTLSSQIYLKLILEFFKETLTLPSNHLCCWNIISPWWVLKLKPSIFLSFNIKKIAKLIWWYTLLNKKRAPIKKGVFVPCNNNSHLSSMLSLCYCCLLNTCLSQTECSCQCDIGLLKKKSSGHSFRGRKQSKCKYKPGD